jgi:hypothetical protein
VNTKQITLALGLSTFTALTALVGSPIVVGAPSIITVPAPVVEEFAEASIKGNTHESCLKNRRDLLSVKPGYRVANSNPEDAVQYYS